METIKKNWAGRRGRLEPEIMHEAVNNVATTTSHLLAIALQRQDESRV